MKNVIKNVPDNVQLNIRKTRQDAINGSIADTNVGEKYGINQYSEENQVTGQDTGQVTGQVAGQDEQLVKIIGFCSIPRSRKEMQDFVGISSREHFSKRYLSPLLTSGQLRMTIPDKPNSRNQKYIKTQK